MIGREPSAVTTTWRMGADWAESARTGAWDTMEEALRDLLSDVRFKPHPGPLTETLAVMARKYWVSLALESLRALEALEAVDRREERPTHELVVPQALERAVPGCDPRMESQMLATASPSSVPSRSVATPCTAAAAPAWPIVRGLMDTDDVIFTVKALGRVVFMRL